MASANAASYAVYPGMRVLSVDPRRPDAAAVLEAVGVLRRGGLVVFPTETVYGLGCRALDESAVARVFAVKGRPPHHPLIAHVTTEGSARELAAVWPPVASRLARAFWPGPLTLVVERASFVPAIVAGGGGSIALRAPSHPVARALLEVLGEPIAAPSANRYQCLSPTCAPHAIRQVGGDVDLVLDGGTCDAGIESTVIDVRGPSARVLRPGAVPMAALRDLVPNLERVLEPVESECVRDAPGMDRRHYAPRAPLLVESDGPTASRLAAELAQHQPDVGLVTLERSRAATVDPSLSFRPGIVERVLPRDPEGYARHLYSTLHELDDAGVRAIVVERVPDDESWCAVADRLARAASKS
ncbi:MAG TPA: L-threonylcarbamoyladenylate synthase [Polyangiaceae bacterium]|nr:L-threonylcarbamoyladenylate synthase [Polyangiaceae bacterium]